MCLNRSLLTLLMGPILVSAGMPADSEPLFASAPLNDQELAEARGGFSLPNGMKVDFGVLMRTSVDGATILETTLQVIGDTVKKSVQAAVSAPFPPAGGPSAQAGNGRAAASAGSASAQSGQGAGAGAAIGDIVAQAGPGGASAGAGTVIAGASQETGIDATIGGLHAVASHEGAQIDGATIAARASTSGGGTLSLAGVAPSMADKTMNAATNAGKDVTLSSGAPADGSGAVVTMNDLGITATAQLPQLLVRHEIGRQISSLVVNTADGRMVDSQLMINLQLDNVQPLALGSAGFRVESLGLDAAIWRATGG